MRAILVDNGTYGLHNVGDIAMLQVAVERLKKLAPDARVKVVTTDPRRLKDLVPLAEAAPYDCYSAIRTPFGQLGGIRRILPNRFHSRALGLERSVRMLAPIAAANWTLVRARQQELKDRVRRWKELMEETDALVFSGGGYLCDSFAQDTRNKLELLTISAQMGKHVALFGQGIGPMADRQSTVLARCLRKASLITLREPLLGPKILADLNVGPERYRVTGDDAIEPASATHQPAARPHIGINLRVSAYSGLEGESALDRLKVAFIKLSDKLQLDLLPIPICLTGADSDLQTFNQHFSDRSPAHWRSASSPADVLKLVSQCQIVITGAYHAAVFALSMGIPAVMLACSDYYLAKHQGLAMCFGNRLCEVIDISSGEPGDRIHAAVERLLREAQEEPDPIRDIAARQVETQKAAYAHFIDMLKERNS